MLLLLAASAGWAQPREPSSPATQSSNSARRAPAQPGPSSDLLAALESVYEDLHANPELSMQETRTAGIAAKWLREYGFDVTEKIGGTGVVGLLRNGGGATVLLRADMDALLMKENSGLPYASTKTWKGASGEAVNYLHGKRRRERNEDVAPRQHFADFPHYLRYS